MTRSFGFTETFLKAAMAADRSSTSAALATEMPTMSNHWSPTIFFKLTHVVVTSCWTSQPAREKNSAKMARPNVWFPGGIKPTALLVEDLLQAPQADGDAGKIIDVVFPLGAQQFGSRAEQVKVDLLKRRSGVQQRANVQRSAARVAFSSQARKRLHLRTAKTASPGRLIQPAIPAAEKHWARYAAARSGPCYRHYNLSRPNWHALRRNATPRYGALRFLLSNVPPGVSS